MESQGSSHLQVLQLQTDQLDVSDNAEAFKDVPQLPLLLVELLQQAFPSMANVLLSYKHKESRQIQPAPDDFERPSSSIHIFSHIFLKLFTLLLLPQDGAVEFARRPLLLGEERRNAGRTQVRFRGVTC